MLEVISRGDARILDASDDGVLLFSEAGLAYMLSARDGNTAARMLGQLPAAEAVVAHQDFCFELIKSRFNLKTSMPCHQAAYFGHEYLQAESCPCEIRQLDLSHLDFVLSHYSNSSDREYIAERLQAGVVFGAFVENQPAGFIGEHAEGSLGMLEILPAYRRRGIGEALAIQATNRHLRQGFTPFSQIKAGNLASLALQKKLGYTVSDELVSWIF